MPQPDILSQLVPHEPFDYPGVIFDFDGTIADSMHVWAWVDREFMSRHGLVEPPDYGSKLAELGFDQGAVYTAELFGMSESPQDIKDEWNALAQEHYATNVFLKPGCRRYLESLRELDTVRLAIATTLTTPLLKAALELNGITDLFDTFVTSSIVNVAKSKPDVYLRAAEEIGRGPASCVVFEDIAPGIRSAKSVGMAAVGVYDSQSGQDLSELRDVADAVISSFEELSR